MCNDFGKFANIFINSNKIARIFFDKLLINMILLTWYVRYGYLGLEELSIAGFIRTASIGCIAIFCYFSTPFQGPARTQGANPRWIPIVHGSSYNRDLSPQGLFGLGLRNLPSKKG